MSDSNLKLELGTDLIEVSRVQEAMKRHTEAFVKRVFTEREAAYCGGKKNCHVHYAGRFAAKEAVLKALGTGLRGGIHWTDMEIVNDLMGKPSVRLTGKALEIAQQKKMRQLEISISHSSGFAQAVAVLLREA